MIGKHSLFKAEEILSSNVYMVVPGWVSHLPHKTLGQNPGEALRIGVVSNLSK